jgi:hypothetical protein
MINNYQKVNKQDQQGKAILYSGKESRRTPNKNWSGQSRGRPTRKTTHKKKQQANDKEPKENN